MLKRQDNFIGVEMRKLLPLFLIIVLISGLYKPTPAQSFPVLKNYHLADSLIKVINSSAKLMSITSDSTFSEGSSHSWYYKYCNLNEFTPLFYFLHTTVDSVVNDSSNNINLAGPAAITLPWINSDSAWVIAEALGGSNFRLLHPNNKITASLGEAVVPHAKPFWNINYRSFDNSGDYLYLVIDATDSSKITSIKSLGKAGINDFRLNQNYPNPFNPSTTISYSLEKEGNVKLTVYNAIGSKVETVVNEYKPAGNYSVQFNGNNLASGIYFYRIIIGESSSVRKMILLK
jgi:hypothetical protein